MHRTIVVGLAAALALGGAGCGSSQRRITEAQFAPTLTEICAQARAATGAAAARERDAPGEQRLRFVTALIAGQRVMADRLDRIAPPAAMRHDFDTFRREMRARLDLFERIRAARSGDMQRVVAANARLQTETFERLDAIQHKYQLRGCV